MSSRSPGARRSVLVTTRDPSAPHRLRCRHRPVDRARPSVSALGIIGVAVPGDGALALATFTVTITEDNLPDGFTLDAAERTPAAEPVVEISDNNDNSITVIAVVEESENKRWTVTLQERVEGR